MAALVIRYVVYNVGRGVGAAVVERRGRIKAGGCASAGQVVLGTAQTPSTPKLQRPECKKSKKKVDTDRTRTCAADANRFLVDLLNQGLVGLKPLLGHRVFQSALLGKLPGQLIF